MGDKEVNISLFQTGYNHLNNFQKEVFDECISKKSFGLSLTVGSGKTLVSLVLALHFSKENEKIIVICSKTLIGSWEHEIKKFFSDKLSYIVYQTTCRVNDISNFKLILTTPDTIAKYYKDLHIEDQFLEHIEDGMVRYTSYNKPYKPYTENQHFFYDTKWSSLIIDEAQNYTNVQTFRCKAIASLCANFRWCTSGTLFDEPKTERILGYYLLINDRSFPRNLPDTERKIKNSNFQGINESLVLRKNNESFVPPKINEYIINNTFSKDEEKVYLSMKIIMGILNERVQRLKNEGDIQGARLFSSYLLAMIIYLRQCVVSPLLPLASVAIDITDFQNKSILSTILNREFKNLELDGYLNNPDSAYSSRIKSVIKIVNKHPKENLVLFTCFRSTLCIIKSFLPKNRKVLTLTSNMNSQQRIDVINDFGVGKGNILILTYSLGSEGLNLQTSNTILLIDFYWNDGTTSQSIGRILRTGQKAKEVNIYYFTSNTAIEKAIYEKQRQKLVMLGELSTGRITSKIKRLKTDDLIKFVLEEETTNALNAIKELKI